MDRWRIWWKLPYGVKLKKLHAWNAWIVLLLAVTGIVLYLPALRGDIAVFRVALKQVHIYLGVLSVIVLLLYLPLIGKHLKQITGKLNQKSNLWIVLFLLAGWSVSGIILWQDRNLPKAWSSAALLWHDLLTFVGVPYAIYHAISRSRWLKRGAVNAGAGTKAVRAEALTDTNDPAAVQGLQAEDASGGADALIKRLKTSIYSRRTFIRWFAGSVLVLAVGPSFYRWIKRATDKGGASLSELPYGADENRMIPSPKPLPESLPPVGGGAKGHFRVYTVTDIPSFTSDTWKFAVGGLVAKPETFEWEDLLKLERKVQVSDFHCVTGWSVYKVTWEGIPLSQLLDRAEVDSKAKYVKFYSGDGVYTDALTLDQARMEDVMVAVLLDGKPIPNKLGGPARLVIPPMYAYKSVKWLQAIELIEKEHIGYWEVRGYDTDAWVRGSRG
jgi:sulfoxide reductase catalytic subunit YedY